MAHVTSGMGSLFVCDAWEKGRGKSAQWRIRQGAEKIKQIGQGAWGRKQKTQEQIGHLGGCGVNL